MLNAVMSVAERCAVMQAERLPAERRHYRMSVRDFGKGRVEVCTTLPYHSPFDAMLAPLKPKAETVEEVNDELKAARSLARSCRRAKQRVRWLVKAMGANHLLTLTYRENMQDIKRLAANWQAFVRSVRTRFPDWKYVMVREYQERGALHIHCAVVGRQDVNHLRACWLAVVGQGAGNIDVKGPTKRWGNESERWNPHKLSSYMCKYMSKDFETAQEEKKRYWASKGTVIPHAVYWLGATNFPDAVKESYAYAHAHGVTQSSVWAADDWRCIWIDGSG